MNINAQAARLRRLLSRRKGEQASQRDAALQTLSNISSRREAVREAISERRVLSNAAKAPFSGAPEADHETQIALMAKQIDLLKDELEESLTSKSKAWRIAAEAAANAQRYRFIRSAIEQSVNRNKSLRGLGSMVGPMEFAATIDEIIDFAVESSAEAGR